jgi:hypothetical protein
MLKEPSACRFAAAGADVVSADKKAVAAFYVESIGILFTKLSLIPVHRF